MGGKVWVPVVSGPLAPYAAGFESWLRSRSYSSSTVANRLSQLDQFNRWLERKGLAARELTLARAGEFARSRREAGLVSWSSPKSAALPLGYLTEVGVVAPVPAVIAEGPLEVVLAGYRTYLLVERRLSEHTVLDCYEPAACLFLSGWEGPGGLVLERLSARGRDGFLGARVF